MKYSVAPLAFALSTSALVIRDQGQQCVQLQSSGSASGVLGQLSDGQNRVGGGYPAACYCLSNGGFTDTSGRGCILTPPTTQFQCDVGASPTTGFAIGSSGSVTYNGSGQFYACPVNDNGEYNVYTQPAPGQDKCVEISLSSGGSCGASSSGQASSPAPAPSQPAQSQPAQSQPAQSQPAESPPANSQPAASQPAQSQPAQSQPAQSQPAQSQPAQSQPAPSQPAPSQPSGSGCPTDLNGEYQYPHLIIPVSSSSPDTAAGTSYNGIVDKTTCSIFNFDIPSSYAGKTCSVLFLFPEQSQLETSSYTLSGEGGLEFSQCSSAASQSTTWDNKPSGQSVGSFNVSPGNSYTVTSGECAAGQTVTYEICATGGLSLNYFQDYNPSPIGLYVREC